MAGVYNSSMPSRNTVKEYGERCYYHVYNRGVSKQQIFHDDDDYTYFLYLLKRHLSTSPCSDKFGRPYRHLAEEVSLVAYCLMPNHFHLLLFNTEQGGMEQLMRSVMTSFSMYYNKKYSHSGRLFQGTYKASLVTTEAYLQHISRYIHLNPENYKTYPYSSYMPLINKYRTEWLSTLLFDEIFDGTIREYEAFVADYKDYQQSLDEISPILADQE